MSILNPTSDGNVEILWSIAKFLSVKKSQDVEKLRAKLRVDDPAYDHGPVQNTIRKALQLGVFTVENDKIGLSKSFNTLTKSNFETEFPKHLRRQIFAKKNNPDEAFFRQEENIASDFTRMVAWSMLQKPSKFSLTFRNFNTMQAELFRQLDVFSEEQEKFINDTRYTQLKRWCSILGLMQGRSGSEFLDATIAVRSELDDVISELIGMEKNEKGRTLYPIGPFLDKLSALLPVLDGGVYQQRIMRVARDGVLSFPDKGRVSQVLSLALIRLEQGALIRLVNLADASGVLLDLAADEPRKVSYIERL